MNLMPPLPSAVESPRGTRILLEQPTPLGQRHTAKEAAASEPAPDFPTELKQRRTEPEHQPAVAETAAPPSSLNPPPALQVVVEGKTLHLMGAITLESPEVTSEPPLVPADSAKIPTAASLPPAQGLPLVLPQGVMVVKQQIVTTQAGLPLPNPDAAPAANAVGTAPTPSQAPPIPVADPAVPTAVTTTGATTAPAVDPLPLLGATEPAAPVPTREAASAGRSAYAQMSVVNETQLVAASLKANSRPDPSAMTITETGPGDSGLELSATSSAVQEDGAQAAGDPDHHETPPSAGATSSAPAVGPSDQSTIPAAPGAATAPASEAGAEPATPSLSVDTPVKGSSETTSRLASVGAGAETDVTRSVRRQVVRQIAGRLDALSGQDKVTIKLNPESLGRLELKFDARDNRLAVVISASGSEAEAALQDNLKDLTDRIVERSARFSHVEVRVEIKDSAGSRPDGKPDAKQDGRQDQRRDQSQRDGTGPDHQQPQRRKAQRTQRAWESAMSWHLADRAASEKG